MMKFRDGIDGIIHDSMAVHNDHTSLGKPMDLGRQNGESSIL